VKVADCKDATCGACDLCDFKEYLFKSLSPVYKPFTPLQITTLVLNHASECPTNHNPEWRCTCTYAPKGVTGLTDD